MSRVRLVPIIVVVVIAFAVLFGGWQAYQRFGVVQPLTSDLKTVPGVQSVTIAAGNPSIIKVYLKKVPDLQTTYDRISNIVSSELSGSSDLELHDSRTGELAMAFESMQVVIRQGVSKGNYTEMITAIDDMSKQLGISDRVTMDEHNIYVQLSKGNSYLYDVISCPMNQGGAAS